MDGNCKIVGAVGELPGAVSRVSSQWFAAIHSVTPFGLTSRAAITGVVYSISLRPGP